MSDDTPPNNGPDLEKMGAGLFSDVLSRFIEPELHQRRESGSWNDDEPLYLFQVLFPYEGAPEVRLNRDVKGTMQVVAARAIAAGEEVGGDDIAGMKAYEPLPADAGVPHVTALAHRDGWSVAFEFGYQHPRRHEFLGRGREFAAAARTALADGHLGVAIDNAFSATELLAKAELLSYQPTISHVIGSRSHGGVSTPYSLWARLDNTDARFPRLLHRLSELRAAGRYLKRELALDDEEVNELFAVLADMEKHVAKIVDADHPDRPRSFNVIATEDIRAGQLVTPDLAGLKPERPR